MERVEFSKIVLILNAAYRNNGKPMIEDKMQADVWYEMLKDLDYAVAEKAVKNMIARSPYQPTIADVRKEYARLVTAPAMGEGEAWGLVREAIRNGTYGATEEFAKLPPVLQKAVGNPMSLTEWASLSSKEVETVVYSNFMKALRGVQEREKDSAVVGAIGAKDGEYVGIAEKVLNMLEEKQ